jgi:hypothetical protein
LVVKNKNLTGYHHQKIITKMNSGDDAENKNILKNPSAEDKNQASPVPSIMDTS